jgi:hypothetical protein
MMTPRSAYTVALSAACARASSSAVGLRDGGKVGDRFVDVLRIKQSARRFIEPRHDLVLAQVDRAAVRVVADADVLLRECAPVVGAVVVP